MTPNTFLKNALAGIFLAAAGCNNSDLSEVNSPLSEGDVVTIPKVEKIEPLSCKFDSSNQYSLVKDAEVIEFSLNAKDQGSRTLYAVLELFSKHLGFAIEMQSRVGVPGEHCFDYNSLTLVITPPDHKFFSDSQTEKIHFEGKLLDDVLTETVLVRREV